MTTCEVDVPAGLMPGATFQAQTANGLVTLTVPEGHLPGQKLQFQVAQPQVVVAQAVQSPVDPRTQADEFPILQICAIAGAYVIGGFSSWIIACMNLCCRPPPTEREREAAWYTNVTAVINLIHLIVLVVCIVFVILFEGLWWLIFIGVHANMFSMVLTNGIMLLLQVLNDQKVEKRQKQQRANQSPPPMTLGAPVVGTPVDSNSK